MGSILLISSSPEVVFAFCCGDGGISSPTAFYRVSIFCSPRARNNGLQLPESILNRIVVGAIRRQECQLGLMRPVVSRTPAVSCAGRLSLTTISPGTIWGFRNACYLRVYPHDVFRRLSFLQGAWRKPFRKAGWLQRHRDRRAACRQRSATMLSGPSAAKRARAAASSSPGTCNRSG